jgi:ribulose-phosphate 3-epimerase
MVEDSLGAVDEWSKLNPVRIIFHIESAKKNTELVIERIKKYGAEVGIAINPDTEFSAIEKYLDIIDFVLVMGVNPGFSGQKFQLIAVSRVEKIKSMNPKVKVGVDGGVKVGVAKKLTKASADVLAAASAIFGSKNIKEALERLRKDAELNN